MPAFRWPAPVFEKIKPKKLRCVKIEPRHLSLTDLEHGDCRYPYGGDEEGEPSPFAATRAATVRATARRIFNLSRNPIPPSECLVSTLLRLVEAE